eukprot:CAMPEP_0113304386 /NCGR_PEP_ID=MMETSP0010_2-20120614/4432_1 /TAXON_ID=216773 ORGANISM="Corethron hystrix, Strain 308" /NCGR_SAMPLE_ID=MMETSP0010_2 /ASSEMBLY_ACC=CAM_ASM_000155 /LENGTH=631 /DNA_ID=CAMNT_0000158591 /DNA_START=104 /DNA_END=1999 /DNA_ORIENTATION=+ /assembly_acc=CAM_ASM_000155
MITKTALVNNMWMFVVHLLYAAAKKCEYAVAPMSEETDTDGGVHVIDEIAAYYIGAEQKHGDRDSGYSLYNLAERGRYYFDTASDGQAKVNLNIITLLRQAQDFILRSEGCHDYEAPRTIRYKMDKIVSQMYIPLIQLLIHHMYEFETNGKSVNEARMISVFARAVVPSIYGCSPSVYSTLSASLYNPDKDFMSYGFNHILAKLQSVYECLGITCEDVGSYHKGAVAQCTDPVQDGPDFDSIAGYVPTTNVRPHLLIDIDILQMSILMENGAYDEARHIYINGRNSLSPNQDTYARSLQSMALSTELDDANLFKHYSKFYGSSKYGHISIMKALGGDLLHMTDSQRKIITINSALYLVLIMYSMRHMWQAQIDCKASKKTTNQLEHSWDQAVAFLVGSLEGYDEAGSVDSNGQLQFNLNRKQCDMFDKCDEDKFYQSVINDELLLHFTRGKEQIQDRYCENLKATIVSHIQPLLFAGLFQGLLSASYEATNLTPNKDGVYTQDVLATLYTFAYAVQPLIDVFYPEGVKTLQVNCLDIHDEVTPVKDGYKSIFDVVTKTYATNKDHEINLDCTQVGTHASSKLGVCHSPDQAPKKSNEYSSGNISVNGSTNMPMITLATSFVSGIFLMWLQF